MQTIEEFMQLFNTRRKANKQSWYIIAANIGQTDIKLKAYGNWVQVIEVSHPTKGVIKDGSASGLSVAGLNDWLIGIIKPMLD